MIFYLHSNTYLTQTQDTMAEWSNATDLSSVLFGGAGSNPAGDILRILAAITLNLKSDFYSDYCPKARQKTASKKEF